MKKIITISLLFSIGTIALNAQVQDEYFAPVSWGNQPSDINWAEEDAGTSHVIIQKASEALDGNIDIHGLTLSEIKSLWDQIEETNFISGMSGGDAESIEDPFDLDADGNGTFGASWKAFFDSKAIYTIFKYVDTEGISTTRWHELGLQTKEYERYEAGWQAAKVAMENGTTEEEFGYRFMNDQYGRFRELGGMKLVFDESEIIVENSTSIGQEGAWGEAIGSTDVGDVTLYKETDGTWWYILELPFSDLKFYFDEWGADEPDNYKAMDPAVQKIISFEPCARATIGEYTYSAWWNGNNESYKLLYTSGSLEFRQERLLEKPSGETEIHYCLNETAEPLYAEGTNLRWYETPGGEYSDQPPVPNTTSAGTQTYYVTQTDDLNVESAPLEINVYIYEYAINIEDKALTCGDSISLELSTNYKGAGSESFTWENADGTISSSTGYYTTYNEEEISIEAVTSTGCAANVNVNITLSSFDRLQDIATVSTLEDNRNKISWEPYGWNGIDSIYIAVKKYVNSDYETLAGLDYTLSNNNFIDNRPAEQQRTSSYAILLKDKCGNKINRITALNSARPAVLSGYNLNQGTNLLKWSEYQNRNIIQYEVFKGMETPPANQVYAASILNDYYDHDVSDETEYYRLKLTFESEYPGEELNISYTNTVEVIPGTGYFADTVQVYDTVYVAVADTLVIDVLFDGTNDLSIAVIKVYPNPAKDRLFVECPDQAGLDQHSIRIISQIGSIIYESSFDNDLMEIDLNDWTGRGLYVLQILNKEGIVTNTKKILLE